MSRGKSTVVLAVLGAALAAGAEFVGRCISAAMEYGMEFSHAIAIAAFYAIICAGYGLGCARIIR